MSRKVFVNIIAAATITVLTVGIVTTAFTPAEKETISNLRQRITALEAAIVGIENDLGTINDNQVILGNDIDILDAGLAGLVADDGPIAQIDRNLLMTQEIVFANHPPIALTDINPIVVCDVSTCTVDIEWTSTPPATGQVEWGVDETYGNLTGKESSLLGYHKQRVGTFPADGTTYHFRVLAELPEGGSTATEGTVTVG